MKISNKLHRSTSIIAGIFILLALFVSALSTLVNAIGGVFIAASVPSVLRELLVQILLIVIMFRGKKDVVSGVMALIMMLIAFGYDMYTYGIQLIRWEQLSVYFDNKTVWIVSRVLSLLAGIANALFCGMIALECFAPGKISGNGLKIFLVMLPVAAMLLVMIGMALYQTSVGMPLWMALLSGGLRNLLDGIGPIVAGIAASIAVKEEPVIYSVYPQYPQYPQQF